MRDKEYSWLHTHLKDARGLLIYPQVLKAGFILVVPRTGVLVVRGGKKGLSPRGNRCFLPVQTGSLTG